MLPSTKVKENPGILGAENVPDTAFVSQKHWASLILWLSLIPTLSRTALRGMQGLFLMAWTVTIIVLPHLHHWLQCSSSWFTPLHITALCSLLPLSPEHPYNSSSWPDTVSGLQASQEGFFIEHLLNWFYLFLTTCFILLPPSFHSLTKVKCQV